MKRVRGGAIADGHGSGVHRPVFSARAHVSEAAKRCMTRWAADLVEQGKLVLRVKVIIFMISGLIAALAGLVLAARYGSTCPDIGTGLELAVITAVVLGCVDINGGDDRRDPGAAVGGLAALWHGPAEHSRPGAEHRHQHPVDLADLAAEPAADYWGTARHQRSDFANLTENSPFCVEARRGLERAVQKGEFLTLRRCTML